MHIPCRFSTEILHQNNTVVVDLAKIFYTKIAQSILVSTKKKEGRFQLLALDEADFFLFFLTVWIKQCFFLTDKSGDITQTIKCCQKADASLNYTYSIQANQRLNINEAKSGNKNNKFAYLPDLRMELMVI